MNGKQGASNPALDRDLLGGLGARPPLSRFLPLGAEKGHSLTLLRPGPPQAEGDEGDDDEDDRAQDDPDNQVGQVTGARHHGPGAHRPLHGFRRWRLRWSQSRGWESTRLTRRLPSCNCEQNSDQHLSDISFSTNEKKQYSDSMGVGNGSNSKGRAVKPFIRECGVQAQHEIGTSCEIWCRRRELNFVF